jgi:hypothetical protein
MAVEYLKRISPSVRLFAGVEAEQDEVELITEAQWFLRPNLFLKLNNSFGCRRRPRLGSRGRG